MSSCVYESEFEILPHPLYYPVLDLSNDFNMEDFDLLGESIHGDCKLLESEHLPPLFQSSDIVDLVGGPSENEKYEIRLHDCMWSGRCKTDMEKNKVTAAKVSQHSFHHHHHSHGGGGDDSTNLLSTSPSIQRPVAPYDVTNNIFVPGQPKAATTGFDVAVKRELDIDRDIKPSIQNIAPGTSLLINSRFNQQKKQQQQQSQVDQRKQNIPAISTSDFLREREQHKPNFLQMRPDSPLSLEDDIPETKHSVDLSGCIVGSNNISLDSSYPLMGAGHADLDRNLRIKTLCEQLEDPSCKITVPVYRTNSHTDMMSDVLNIIKAECNDIDDKSDTESETSDLSHSKSHSPSSGYGSQSPEYSSPHSDHSYVRSKGGDVLSGLGVETPSDSDEEIDVVSVGDKKLPTNPSDKDRRVLQTKVANRVARMVTTSNGVKTIPPVRPDTSNRRNIGYSCNRNPDPSSGGPTSVKKAIYSPVASMPSSTKFASSTQSSRKRNTHVATTYKDDYTPTSKRSRSKKQRAAASNRRHQAASMSLDQDEADTIEKRNLHNDMERQRRIGLKNLFEALKRQIPSIKDKDRAPKVNILREAAKLCDQLTRDDLAMQHAKQSLQAQLKRRTSFYESMKEV